VCLTTRNDRDLAVHFPLASAAIEPLPVRSYGVDSEAIVRDDSALAVFGLSEAMGLSTVLFIG
jgi:hypothetical protein